ncbi:hypothetical protein [Micromonospora sp. CA-111912]|uniref:hypothetical protein n=1 Tax=Micromonospora sp. CA-111912 TaxID=3239955 RepID=UPI003D942B29
MSTLLVLWVVGPIFELPVTVMAVSSFPEVAADAAFGSPGTQVVLAAAFVMALLAAGVSWAEKQVSKTVQCGAGVVSWAAAGLVAAVMLGFLVGGEWVVFGVLLAHSAASLGVLGWLAVRSASNVPLGHPGRR